MILFLRKHILNNSYWLSFFVLLFVFMLAMPALFRRDSFRSQRSGTVLATVNGDDIYVSDFTRRVLALQEQLQFMGLDQRATNERAIALNSLFEDVFLNRVAQSLHVRFDDQYIADKLANPYYLLQELFEFVPPRFIVSGAPLDGPEFARILRGKGLTVTDFEQFVERNLARKLVRDVVTNAAYVPLFAVRAAYIQEYSAKKFLLVRFPLQAMLNELKKETVADADLKQFWQEQNRTSSRYLVPEKRDGVVWEFPLAKYGIVVSEKEIEDYYLANKNLFVATAPKIKVRHIFFAAPSDAELTAASVRASALAKELLENPALFSEKATTLSDAADAKNGGMTDFFARGEKGQAFERAAFKLKKDGEISPIIRTPEGLEIIQRVEKQPATYKPLSAVSAQIKVDKIDQAFKRRFNADMERLRVAYKTDPQAIEAFASEKKAKKSELGSVTADSSLPAAQKLFALKEKGFGFFKDGNSGFVVQLNTIKKSHLPELETIKGQVTADLYRDRAIVALRKKVEEARKALFGADATAVAQKYGATVRPIDWITAKDTKRLEELDSEGIDTRQMVQMDVIGQMAVSYGSDGAYIVKLQEIEPFNEQEFGAKKDELARSLLKRRRLLTLNGFIASLNRNATIKVNEKAFELEKAT